MNEYDPSFGVTEDMLQQIVMWDKKQRYHMWNGRIRANQGHSIDVDLELTEVQPPELLFHGTSDNNVDSIRKMGLLKMKRQYVHLSPDKETAMVVARRRVNPLVLTIAAGEMHRNGHKFYRSENGVWLTDHVPSQYINSLKASDCELTFRQAREFERLWHGTSEECREKVRQESPDVIEQVEKALGYPLTIG